MKAVKLFIDEKNFRKERILNLIFGERSETIKAASELIKRMKKNKNLSMTRREMRLFAKELQDGILGFKYSYHNFYTKLLKKLIELGFVEKDVVIWNEKKKKTEIVYQLRLMAISERAPQSGFIKKAWQISKLWNDYIREA